MACVAGKALAFVARGRAFVARTVRRSASYYAWHHRNKLCSNHCGDEEASAGSCSCAMASSACVATVYGAQRVTEDEECGFGVYGVPWPQVVVGEAVGFSSSLEAVAVAVVSMAMESSS
ncbi:hypothetical protein GUJ93_ZPchr0013g36155 [Zizania palustris]|uniref:Uncharacterized protein n=1 Tax=Zizania palustris TaxID=103762 RepID=A0A8J5X804_ZIZPA|nr:hypothetical protein GUJ93_ZPchr0013g36155 [Zizania palustris]